jgi:mannose-1-phosphate guanylyltransferase / phosphomannomutase
MINESGYLAIVITNQPVVARGEISLEGLKEIHKKLETLLGKEGAYLDAIYFCPHYPESGFLGEVKELKIECECRKPKIGLLLKAKERFNIDLTKSWFIGDSDLDIECGQNAENKTILIKTFKETLSKPDYVAESLLDAVKISLNVK